METRTRATGYELPSVTKGIGRLIQAVNEGGLPKEVQELVSLRASQINGCSACVHGHIRNLSKEGASTEKAGAVAAWREAPFFTDAERSALELAERVTRLADRSADSVPDDLWDDINRHFDEKQVSALVLVVALTNLFNRLNTTYKVPAGTTWD